MSASEKWLPMHQALSPSCSLGHVFQATDHLAFLAGDPVGVPLSFSRALPLQEGQRGGVADAVGQRFPALDFGALAVRAPASACCSARHCRGIR